MATTPGASLPLDASLLLIVANLEGLDLKGFAPSMARPFGWRSARPSFTLALDESAAYRSSPMRSAISTNRPKDFRSGKEGVSAPFERRGPQTREGLGLKAGALLVREWKGRLERIMILEEGFAWNGQTFGSLSRSPK